MQKSVHTIQEYFDTLHERFYRTAAENVSCIIQYEFTGKNNIYYHVILENGTFTIVNGIHPSPTATIKTSEEVFVKLANGEMNGTLAYITKKIKVTGNLLFAQKLQSIFPIKKS